jgi:hypothetical protein
MAEYWAIEGRRALKKFEPLIKDEYWKTFEMGFLTGYEEATKTKKAKEKEARG